MFYHNFKYSLKVLFKNKMLRFWTFAFPILLGLFFNLAFKDIEKNETLEIIEIAIIKNEEYEKNILLKETLETLSKKENKNRLFKITYTDLEKAKKLLEKDKITGYILVEDEPHITISRNGINATILKNIIDEISSNNKILTDLLNKEIEQEYKNENYNINYEKIYESTLNKIINSDIKLNNISNKNMSYTMIEYYTLIAMACLYGGTLSMFIVNLKLPNMNSIGKRTASAPINKRKLIISSLLASYLVQLVGLTLLFLFTIFIIKVDYGTNLPLIILLACVGSLAGLSLGVLVSTTIKSNENAKIGILIAITMLGCFLSGMMGITMKYIIDKNIPIINKINPANMITDGFYSLYYYKTLDRYFFNIISLLVFSTLMITISYKGLRRKKYDSI